MINFGVGCAGQADEDIGEIFFRVDTEAQAGLHEARENGRGLATGGRPCEHPIVSTDHNRPESVFRVIVMYFEEAVVNKLHESRPVIEGVFDRVSQGCGCPRIFLLVEPDLESVKDRLGVLPPNLDAFFFGESKSKSFDAKEALNHAHAVVSQLFFSAFGIFIHSVDVSPAFSRSGTIACFLFIFKDLVVLVRAVSEKKSFEAFEKLPGVVTTFVFSEQIELVGMFNVAAEKPDAASLSLARSLEYVRHAGAIGVNESTFEDEDSHSVVNNCEFVGRLLEPARHSGPVYGHAEIGKNPLLSIERQMVGDFRSDYMRQKGWARVTLINWLQGLRGLNDVAFALGAGVFIFDVFDAFVACGNVFQLVGDSEAYRGARNIAAWTQELHRVGDFMVFRCFFLDRVRSLSAAATVGLGGCSYASPLLFCSDSCGYFVVEFFAWAFECVGRGLGGASTKVIAIFATFLFLKHLDAVVELKNERMAGSDLPRQWGRKYDGNRFGSSFCHFSFLSLSLRRN